MHKSLGKNHKNDLFSSKEGFLRSEKNSYSFIIYEALNKTKRSALMGQKTHLGGFFSYPQQGFWLGHPSPVDTQCQKAQQKHQPKFMSLRRSSKIPQDLSPIKKTSSTFLSKGLLQILKGKSSFENSRDIFLTLPDRFLKERDKEPTSEEKKGQENSPNRPQ